MYLNCLKYQHNKYTGVMLSGQTFSLCKDQKQPNNK